MKSVDPAWMQAARDWDDLCLQLGTLLAQRASECTSGYPTRMAVREWVCDAVSASVLAGRVAFRAANAPSCLARLGTMPCGDVLVFALSNEGLAALCPDVLDGQITAGAACTRSFDCAAPGSFACHLSSSCRGTCQVRVALGERCTSMECAPGLTCSAAAGRCIPIASEGEPCDRDLAQCQDLLVCDASGTCRSPEVGDACTRGGLADLFSCGLFLDCRTGGQRSDGGTDGTCAPFAAVGEPCSPGDSACGQGSYCMSVDGGGVCTPDGRLGEPCGPVLNGPEILAVKECLDGYCDRRPGELGGHCQPFHPLGEACQRDAECDVEGANRYCVSGKCRSTACP